MLPGSVVDTQGMVDYKWHISNFYFYFKSYINGTNINK